MTRMIHAWSIWNPERGRKRDQSVEDDRLRTIIQMIVDQEEMNPSKLVREAGFDTASKEWRAAYQAIKRWSEGRESKVQKPKDREKKGSGAKGSGVKGSGEKARRVLCPPLTS